MRFLVDITMHLHWSARVLGRGREFQTQPANLDFRLTATAGGTNAETSPPMPAI